MPDDLLDALVDVLAAQAVNVTRGFHNCEYCSGGSPGGPLRFQHRDKTVWLGNGEIRIPAADGALFAAPTLIGHYIRDHGYRPPAVFSDAVSAFRDTTTDLARGWLPAAAEN